MRFLLVIVVLLASTAARADTFDDTVQALAVEDKIAVKRAITALGASEEPAALGVLEALQDRKLRVAPDGRVVIQGDGGAFRDAVTGAPVAADLASTDKIVVTNALRRELRSALARRSLSSPDVAARRAAAAVMAKSPPGPDLTEVIRERHAVETDATVRRSLRIALAFADLSSDDPARKRGAIAVARDIADPAFKPALQVIAKGPDAELSKQAKRALAAIESEELKRRVVRDLLYGLSQGALLLLIALGLAVTFGLMRVINMAHGEMLMLGAYATYVVQTLFQRYAPNAIDWYLPVAVPVAFGVCFVIGVALERTVIRFLYGRPLETLLATWGISLLLIQTVRTVFGAQNVTVANPSWLSGGWTAMPGVVIPYARIATAVFAAVVVGFVWWLIKRTSLGLQVRAITQNRAMARGIGVPTDRVDMITFGLGSAVAGLAGVALSQVGNVGPEVGQLYIVDSFMVVVVGGVGELFGAVVAGLGLGVVNKLLEPVSGAVLGKIIVFGLIILFIQWRPQGLFSLKGRAAEAEA